MAEEHADEPVAQQASTSATVEDDKPKDSRSFEERIAALTKPEPIPQPDQQQVKNNLAVLNEKIEKCDKRLSEIKAALERSSSSRETSSEVQKIIEQLKTTRVAIKGAEHQRDDLNQQLRDVKAVKEANQKHLQDLRKSLKYDDVQHVDEKIKELENKISYGQCADLKEEKKVMAEIKNLQQMKALIAQYNQAKQASAVETVPIADLERKRTEANVKLGAARKDFSELEKALETARGKTPTRASTNELWKEQKELYGQIKAHRAEIKKVNTEFREEAIKFQQHQRAFENYKYQLQKIQNEQRRAEWEARKKAEEAPVDADAPSDDPLIGHPWAEEILQCSDLEKLLVTFLPKESKSDVKEEQKEKLWLKGAAGKMSGKEDEDPFASVVVSKKGKNAKKIVDPASIRIVLTLDTISSLSAIGIPIPTTAAEVQPCLDKLGEKKAAFKEMTEKDKKEAKAARAGNNNKVDGRSKGAAKSSDLVAVDIACAAADRVTVSLSFPALSASA